MPLPGSRLYANSIWIGPANADNYMPGRAGYSIYGSVQHHSASTLSGLIYRFTHSPAVSGGGASAHFAIDREEETRDGLLGFGQYAIRYQLVDTADMAFADSDYWENLTTIAVEHVRQWGSGPGTAGYEPITDAQYRSSTELQMILGQDNGYPLDLTRITPHNFYSQTTCPGDLELVRIIHPTTVGGADMFYVRVMTPAPPAANPLYGYGLCIDASGIRHVGSGEFNFIQNLQGKPGAPTLFDGVDYSAVKDIPWSDVASPDDLRVTGVPAGAWQSQPGGSADNSAVLAAITDLKAHPDPTAAAIATRIENALKQA